MASTSFFEQVYQVVAMIPRGRVATYGQIAAYLGNPRAARTVGWALSSMPSGMDLPWHRVINSKGRIGGPPGGRRAHEQRALLEEEGVTFDESGRVDLKEYGWRTPQ
jgi:methylated-DNA-protein-cysteine methyltransferase-like protein